MRAILRTVAGFVLVLLNSACLVETETTLSDPDPRAADARLPGTWYFAEGGETMLFTVIAHPDDKDGVYRVVHTSINPRATDPVRSTHYSAWRTVVNGQSYLNVRRTGGSTAETPARAIVSYDLGSDGTLVLRLMEVKHVVAAIGSGKLKGRVKKGRYLDEATITSPRAELAAFIAGADRDALFAVKTKAMRRLPEAAN